MLFPPPFGLALLAVISSRSPPAVGAEDCIELELEGGGLAGRSEGRFAQSLPTGGVFSIYIPLFLLLVVGVRGHSLTHSLTLSAVGALTQEVRTNSSNL